MEKEFLNHFFNTRRMVSMLELTNTKQQNGEPNNKMASLL